MRLNVVTYPLILFVFASAASAEVTFDFDSPSPLNGWTVHNGPGRADVIVGDFDPDADDELQFYPVNNTDNQNCTPGEVGSCSLSSTLTSPMIYVEPGHSEIVVSGSYTIEASDGDGDTGADEGSFIMSGSSIYELLVLWGGSDDRYSEDFVIPVQTTLVGGGSFQLQVQLGDYDGFLTVSAFTIDSITITNASLTSPADFDADGDVDGDDFLAWQSGFGLSAGAEKSDGDYDNDGDVDGDDFLGWQSAFDAAGGSSGAAAPEPGSLLVAAVGIAILLAVRRTGFGSSRA